MKRRAVVVLLASVLVLTFLAGCGGSQQPAAPAPKEEPKPKTVKIGAIFPLTGPAAATGVKLKYAVEVAQEIINNPHPEINLPLAKDAGLPNLGGMKVEFVFADHQANPEVAK